MERGSDITSVVAFTDEVTPAFSASIQQSRNEYISIEAHSNYSLSNDILTSKSHPIAEADVDQDSNGSRPSTPSKHPSCKLTFRKEKHEEELAIPPEMYVVATHHDGTSRFGNLTETLGFETPAVTDPITESKIIDETFMFFVVEDTENVIEAGAD